MVNVAWQAAPDAVAGGGSGDAREWLTRNVTIAKAMQGIEVQPGG